MSGEGEHEYLTARELANLLRVRERKVYELAAAGEVPCSRATGKLLFRRVSVDAWLARSSSGPAATPAVVRPDVIGGSHDPLLDWALRESGAGLATLFDGSLDGLDRFAAGEGRGRAPCTCPPPSGERERSAAPPDGPDGEAPPLAIPDEVHARSLAELEWNVPLVRERFGDEPVVLIAFARRVRGLIVAAGDEARVRNIENLAGCRVVPRQRGRGQPGAVFERLVAGPPRSGRTRSSSCRPARTESDAALAIAEGRADVAFGLAGPAAQLGLGFVPIATERFDLLVDRRAWFEPPLQRLAAFCATAAFRERAIALGGYDVTDVGAIRFNGRG